MKTVLLLLLALATSMNVYCQEGGAKNKFDFWVGEWKLTWTNAQGAACEGKNIITKTLGSKVIEENFSVVNDPTMAGFKGKSWSVYNPNTKAWYQTWVDNQSGYIAMEGSFDGEKRIFQTAPKKLANGKTATNRMVFYNIQADSFDWDWEVSVDGGATWTLSWRIHYVRIK